ncbi:MAG TPA: alpha/beta hydrolase, partial [Sphingomonas sp.]|nr:alpha/beta hydrolase [Sphingomonas sp.]
DSDFLDARQDMQAALDWARARGLPIVLWGSSYSSALIFPLAAADPTGIKALLAFSPGEYFDDKTMIERAAAKVKVPVFITCAPTSQEIQLGAQIADAIKARKTFYVPKAGVHGSSTLIAAKDPEGAAANWRAVLDFLHRAVG